VLLTHRTPKKADYARPSVTIRRLATAATARIRQLFTERC
jgi:hypothetical protein